MGLDGSPKKMKETFQKLIRRVDFKWILVIGILFYYYLHWHTLDNFVASIDNCKRLFCDFQGPYYRMGQAVFAEFLPVHGFYYSGFAAIIFGLISFPSAQISMLAWGAVQLLFTFALFYYPFTELIKDAKGNQAVYVFLFLTSLPVLHNFKWGQVSIIATALAVWALYFYVRERSFPAVILLAIAISLKYYPVIFLLYPLIARRDIKFTLATIGVSLLLLFVLPAVLFGIPQTFEFYKTSIIVNNNQQFAEAGNSQYFLSVLARQIHFFEPYLRSYKAAILGYLVPGFNIALMWYWLRDGNRKYAEYWGLAFIFTTIPFLLTSSWPHYFVYLPLVQMFILVLVESRPSNPLNYLRLLLWIGSVVLSSSITFNIIDDWRLVFADGFYFFSNLLLMLILYSFLVFRYDESSNEERELPIWSA